MHQIGCRMDRLRPVLAAPGPRGSLLGGLIGALLLSAAPALAGGDDDDASNRAPRAAMEMCDLGVVLVVADDRLQAYVDLIADNAPAIDAAITVTRAHSRSPLTMEKVADGLFTAPYKPARGVREDNLTVAVSSPAGRCEKKSTLVLEAASPAPVRGVGFGRLLTIALVSGLIGSAVTVLLLQRRARRSGVAVPLAKAT